MTCELVSRRDAGAAPLWDRILRTPNWDVVHAFGTSVEGWLVIVARRHVESVSELTDDEAVGLGTLIRNVSAALHEVVGCAKTYVAQYAEHPEHAHVHFHVIPRAADLPAEGRGPGIFRSLGVPDEDAVPESRRDEIAAAIRRLLVDPSDESLDAG